MMCNPLCTIGPAASPDGSQLSHTIPGAPHTDESPKLDEASVTLDALGGCLLIVDQHHKIIYVTDHVTELLGFTQVREP